MRYQLTPIFCRPWTLNGLSLRLIESHYENNYGGDLRRLNAIAEKLDSLDFANTPTYIVNSLKREELIALNSTLLHELYFASLAFGDGRPTEMLARALTSDFGSVDRWRDPERVQEWASELSKSDPVIVFCVYGFHVGCRTAAALREAGFDAKYMKGGHSAWKAIGGATKINT